MKLTVLGSGISTTAAGTDFRYPAAHLVEAGEEKILFDAGIGVLPQLAKLGVQLTDIHTICITHVHADHFAIEPILQTYYLYAKFGNFTEKPKLRILGPSDIEARVRASYTTKGWTFDEDLLQTVDVTFIPYEDKQAVELAPDVTLTPHKTLHYSLEAYALRLDHQGSTIAYSGDSTLSDGLEAAASNADIFLCEAFVAAGLASDTGHVSPDDAGKVAQRAGCGQLVFTHYTGTDSADTMKVAAQSAGFTGTVEIANDLDNFTC